jgi:glucokinase
MTAILAGDVGGTKTNLALVDPADAALAPIVEASIPNHGHASLGELVRTFLARGGPAPVAACFGIAGPVADGRAQMSNLAWSIDARVLAADLGFERVILLNDLEATGHGIATLAPGQLLTLNEGTPHADGNAALIAAGTGLGEAILFWDGTRRRISASEGGDADFAPRDAAQMTILARLAERFGHVSWERLVSGPGLHNLYGVLDDVESPDVARRIAAAADPSAVIAELALAGGSARCIRALDTFVTLYGAEAGNLALKALSTAGVYVGGGIAPKILPKLRDGAFLRAFCDKGRFADLLRSMPVRVILEPKTALRGAAAYLAASA